MLYEGDPGGGNGGQGGDSGATPTGSAGRSGDQGTNPPQGGPGGSDTQTDPNTDAALAQARREAINERKSRQELEARLKEIEESQLSETEKLRKQLDAEKAAREDVERTARGERVDREIDRQAIALGITDLEAASRLVDRDGFEDTEGKPDAKVIEAKLKALIKARPWLKGATVPVSTGDGGPSAGAPARSASDGDNRKLSPMERMSRAYGVKR